MSYGPIVKQKLEKFKNQEIPLSNNSKIKFNHYATIKRINHYLNDKFVDRPVTENDTAIFWNLATPLIPHFAKNIDLDTKDLMPYGQGETNFFQTWVLKLKFQNWLKENHFAIKLSDLSEGLATYGSIIWKRFKDENGKVQVEEVDLNNIFFDTSVDLIEKSDVIEIHTLNEAQLIAKRGVWDFVDEILAEMKRLNKDEVEIWEYTGYLGSEYVHCFGYGYDENSKNLFEEPWDNEKFQYYDFHLGRYRGRWMRMGVVERLFKLQQRMNTLINQNAAATEIASLLLLRSREANMAGNVLEEAVNGQIIPSEDLQQIILQNPGMANFANEINAILSQAHKLCLTPDVIIGEALPSGTPFRSLATINNAAKSAFKSIRDGMGEIIAWLLLKDIFPSLVENWNAGEIFEMAGDEADIRIFDEENKKRFIWENYKENLLRGVPMDQPTLAMLENEFETQVQNKARKLEIPKNFFNFKFGIRLNVTGEEFDKQTMNGVFESALQMIAQNPALTNIPLFKQYLEQNGVPWWKLTPAQQQQIQDMVTGAKGVSPLAASSGNGPAPEKMPKNTEMMTA